MNTNEPQFGEPWKIRKSWHQCPFERSDGKTIPMSTKDNDRIISCVNLLAGHKDLGAVVVVEREALEEVADLLESLRDTFNGSILSNGCHKQLANLRALLNPPA